MNPQMHMKTNYFVHVRHKDNACLDKNRTKQNRNFGVVVFFFVGNCA